MLIPRTFKLATNKNAPMSPCKDCPIMTICMRYTNSVGDIINIDDSNSLNYEYKSILDTASTCKKTLPQYRVVETTPKEKYTLVGKAGNTILEADSFGGLILRHFLTLLLSFVVIAIIAAIVCGIASIF